MPTFRPDIFAQKVSGSGRTTHQVVVEVEIRSSLLSGHTIEQLLLMDEFIEHQRKKRIRCQGILAIPSGKQLRTMAVSLLDGYFPTGTDIEILQ